MSLNDIPAEEWNKYAFNQRIKEAKERAEKEWALANGESPADVGPVPVAHVGLQPLERQVGGSHYKNLKIQPIEYAMANDLNVCEANIVKYVTRHHAKGGAEDIRKVIHYAELLLQMKYGETR